jgi:hypothetical protein
MLAKAATHCDCVIEKNDGTLGVQVLQPAREWYSKMMLAIFGEIAEMLSGLRGGARGLVRRALQRGWFDWMRRE